MSKKRSEPILQDWVTVRGASTMKAIAAPDEWPELSGFADATVYVDGPVEAPRRAARKKRGNR